MPIQVADAVPLQVLGRPVSMNKRREKLSDLRRLADCYLHFASRDPEMQRGPDWPQDDPHWHLAKALEPVLEFVNGIENPEERAILALNACSIIADEAYDLFAANIGRKNASGARPRLCASRIFSRPPEGRRATCKRGRAQQDNYCEALDLDSPKSARLLSRLIRSNQFVRPIGKIQCRIFDGPGGRYLRLFRKPTKGERSIFVIAFFESARGRLTRSCRACFLYRKVSRTKHGRLAALSAIHPARPVQIAGMQR